MQEGHFDTLFFIRCWAGFEKGDENSYFVYIDKVV